MVEAQSTGTGSTTCCGGTRRAIGHTRRTGHPERRLSRFDQGHPEGGARRLLVVVVARLGGRQGACAACVAHAHCRSGDRATIGRAMAKGQSTRAASTTGRRSPRRAVRHARRPGYRQGGLSRLDQSHGEGRAGRRGLIVVVARLRRCQGASTARVAHADRGSRHRAATGRAVAEAECARAASARRRRRTRRAVSHTRRARHRDCRLGRLHQGDGEGGARGRGLIVVVARLRRRQGARAARVAHADRRSRYRASRGRAVAEGKGARAAPARRRRRTRRAVSDTRRARDRHGGLRRLVYCQ